MNHTPDSSLGGLVKGVVKDVVNDLASIPTEAARQAVGLPSRNLEHKGEVVIQKLAMNEKGTGELGDIQNVELESQNNLLNQDQNFSKSENDTTIRNVVYQDVSGDQVRKEHFQVPQTIAQTNYQQGLTVNQQARTTPVIQTRDTQEARVQNVFVDTRIGNENIVGNGQTQVKKDVVFEWLNKSVWQGYGE